MVQVVYSGADLGGGCRGCAPPPQDDLRFSDTTGILQKKKLCGLLVLKYSKRRVHPLLKKILDPPLLLETFRFEDEVDHEYEI